VINAKAKNSMNSFIIFPHQLFEDIATIKKYDHIYLVEEHLFFNQYPFHKTKLVFHRAAMKAYENYLLENKIKVTYIAATTQHSDIRNLIPYLLSQGSTKVGVYALHDFNLEKRIKESCHKNNIEISIYESDYFINTQQNIEIYFANNKKLFQTDFYIAQRKKLKILVTDADKPIGDKWTFDADNRLKYPKAKTPPAIKFAKSNLFYDEAVKYVNTNFEKNYGNISTQLYPITFQETRLWLQHFFETRFYDFGIYEDAIVSNEVYLHHSVLTPMLNCGLITPKYIIDQAIIFANKNNIPLNSLEGFIRQILGWREFIRSVYVLKSVQQRTCNYWKFTTKIPESFWLGTTGILPIDDAIKKINNTAYCHHIERLMILGNFMLLCEFDPNEVYKWFSTLFIDAYDWVMVPNVYGMSQFADGGLMASKPYISGSNYVLKMSNYKKEPWCEIWDGLFWRFMHVHRNFFLSNPRLGMLVHMFDKQAPEKQAAHLTIAANYLKKLHTIN
jgi:deoxyribodipyrimidine photolyase-related protein